MGSIFDSYRVASSMGVYKAVRLSHRIVAFMDQETRPDCVLATSVEGFDVGLKSAANAVGGFSEKCRLLCGVFA